MDQERNKRLKDTTPPTKRRSSSQCISSYGLLLFSAKGGDCNTIRAFWFTTLRTLTQKRASGRTFFVCLEKRGSFRLNPSIRFVVTQSHPLAHVDQTPCPNNPRSEREKYLCTKCAAHRIVNMTKMCPTISSSFCFSQIQRSDRQISGFARPGHPHAISTHNYNTQLRRDP